MTVVLDSNIIVAALAARGLCAALFEYASQNCSIAVSDQILSEVEVSLAEKVRADAGTIGEALSLLRAICSYRGSPAPIEAVSRDKDDDGILALAAEAGADCIVSGDKDLLVLGSYRGIPILSPRVFYETIKS